MEVTSATQTALQGIQRGVDGLQQIATEVASADRMEGNAARSVAEPLVEQIVHTTQVEASAQVVRAEDEMVGSLFDDTA